MAPVGIGLALFVAELFGLYWTGGSLNPARAFGPAVVQRSFPGHHWLYCMISFRSYLFYANIIHPGIGPILGALLAAAFYKVLKVLNYEDVNGDQDKAADEEPDEGKGGAKDEEKGQPNGRREGSSDRRSSDRRTRDSQRSRRSQPHADRYSPNRRSGQYGSPQPPARVTSTHRTHPGPPPPATYPNGQPYVQDVYAQDRVVAGHPAATRGPAY